MGMSDEEIDYLLQAAELHDVGKMAIPDAILKKPGPLDQEEWHFIRGHTVIGERIVSAAPALAPVALLDPLQPRALGRQRLSGPAARGQIPLGSRIIAVCDSFDAMIGSRPHRLGNDRRGRARRARALCRDAVRSRGGARLRCGVRRAHAQRPCRGVSARPSTDPQGGAPATRSKAKQVANKRGRLR